MIKLTELRLFDCTAGGTVVPDVFFDNALRTCVADVGEMAKVKIHLQRKKKAAQIQVVSVVEQPAESCTRVNKFLTRQAIFAVI